jgi:hypothetical protein
MRRHDVPARSGRFMFITYVYCLEIRLAGSREAAILIVMET